MQQIILSVKRSRFRQDDESVESADQKFAECRPQVLRRDKSTCCYCDFQSEKWMDVHHRNDRHADNRLENLETTCKICHACHHIGFAGGNKGGVMIYLPEISQVHLNRLVRALFIVSRIGSKSAKNQAANCWNFLTSRSSPLKSALGTHNPVDFANALLSVEDDFYASRESRLAPIRFLISPRSRMLQLPKGVNVIDYWAKECSKVSESDWSAIADQLFGGTAA